MTDHPGPASPAPAGAPAPGSPPAPGPPPAPAGVPARWARRRVPGWLAAVAVATAVASVITFATVLLWPAGPDPPAAPLAFHRFSSVGRIEFDQPARTAFTAVLDRRGYAAWEREGELRVVAFDLTTGEPSWEQAVTGAARWSRIYPVPDGLLVFAYQPDPTARRRMLLLDHAAGQPRWHRDVRGDDHLFLVGGTLTWLDRDGGALRGLDPASGDERWRQELPEDGEPTVVPVLTGGDLGRPADLAGNPTPGENDHRVVLVHPDRSARVVDARDGRTLTEGTNVADPDDRLLAYRDRLFVAPAAAGYQLVSFDLAELTRVPRTHYAAPDTQRYPELLEPCGDRRVCLLESVSFNRQTIELVVVDAVDGGALWRAPSPGAEHVLGVGSWVAVAAGVTFEPSVVLYAADGARVLERGGLVVRLDAGNLLVLGGIGSITGGVSVAGIAIEDGEAVDLGRLPEEVFAEQCAWSRRYLVCPDPAGAEIWRFAD